MVAHNSHPPGGNVLANWKFTHFLIFCPVSNGGQAAMLGAGGAGGKPSLVSTVSRQPVQHDATKEESSSESSSSGSSSSGSDSSDSSDSESG
jgi:hypothetical protein